MRTRRAVWHVSHGARSLLRRMASSGGKARCTAEVHTAVWHGSVKSCAWWAAWDLHVGSACGICMWDLHVGSARGICMWDLHVGSGAQRELSGNRPKADAPLRDARELWEHAPLRV
eukprot:2690601-Prymnesium_polylepis.2